MLLFLARETDELKPVEVCDAVLLAAAGGWHPRAGNCALPFGEAQGVPRRGC